MKISQLRISTILLFFFFSFQVFSQDGSGSFKGIFSPDSIAGFDEVLEKNNALAIGLYGPEFNAYMFQKKRQFINEKYKFPFVDPEPAIAAHYRYSSSSINAAPCVNEGFELGNFTGWAISQGTNGSILSGTVSNSACNNNPCPTTIGVGAFASVVTTPYFDAFMNLSIPNSPFSGSKVAKLNNSTPSFAPVIRITQNFPVTVNNSLYDFAYYAVMQANSPHLCCEQPYMYVKMRDCFGNLLPTCPVFSITLPGTGCPGTGPTSWVITSTFARSNGWQRYSIDLAQYIGCSITMEITVGHCQYTGHYGYAYFDSGCNTMDFSVNSNTVSAPSPAPVTATVPCASTATINGPSGLGPYLWNGPPGSGVTTNTNQAIVVTAAGQYSVSMTPVGICNPINRIINLNFPPPTTINVSPTSSICTSGSVTTSTITASGPFIYSWTPGGSTSPSIVVSPSVTTIYTLEAKTGTCNGTFTRQISVNTTPTVNILPSNTALCPGQTGTLSAIGASTYVWFPGGLVGSTVSITQTATTTYTAIGTSSAGCTDTETVTIGMNGAPVVSAIVFGSTLVCAGSVVTLAGFGAASFTWMPGLLTSNPQTVTPYVTTTYTAIGASGTCTNLATVTVSADPGPSLTVAASPTLICPGYNSTLTAFGSAALGYTWAPGSTISPSIVVAPFVPTTYSVFSNNALSCISLYTLAPVINPVPIMTISPATPSVCYGSTFTLTAAGGSTYTWNPGSVTGSAIAVSPSTSTTYTIVGSNGTCTSSINSSLTVVPLPTVSASSSTASICSGQTLTLSATGAAQYTWMPGTMTASSVVISPTITTTYTVTGNTAACETTDTITIVVNNGPTLTAVASPTAICPGFTSTLSSSGAVSYTWNPSFINFSVVAASPTANTIYTVTGETIFGCLSSKTVGLIVNPVPTVNPASSTPSICVGSTASLTATGAVTYTWNPGSLTGSNVPVSPATTTNYTVVGSNSLGCTDQKTITLIVVPNPTVSPVANSASICTGFSSTLSATGATTYTWNPGALTGSSAIVSPTISTNYTLVGNSAGCTNSSTVLLTVNNGPTLTPVASPTAICPGFTSTLSSTGAVSYTWNPGALSASAIAVSPAVTTNYSVTGATAFGCLTTRTLGLVVSPIPTVNPVASSPSICIGGTSSLSATGALTYTWNPGNLTGSTVAVSPTTTTTYTVVGTNSVTCTDQRTVTITVVPLPTVSPVSTPPAICTGFSSTLTGTGATTYSWNPGALSGSSAVVAPTITTTYTLTGNTAGCSSSSTLALIVNYGPTLTPVASPTAICPGFTSTLSSTGAVSYTWNPGTLTGSAIVVSPPAGTSVYSVTGATAFGCLTTNTLSLLVNPTPTITPSLSSPSICVGSSATLSALGAASYTWNPGALSGSAVAVSPTTTTTYTVDAASAVGCAGQNTITLIVVPNPTVSPVSNPVAICTGFSSTLSAIGASNYTWTPGALTGSSAVVSPTLTTTYTVVGNTAGCTGSSTVLLTVNYGPTLTAVASPTAICPGFTSTLSSTGAVSYTWNPGALTGSAMVVSPPAGTSVYSVTGATAFGCLTTNTLSLLVNPTPTITPSLSSPSICVGSSATLSAIGAASYTWNPGALSGSAVAVSPITTTNYTVAATSSAGCAGQNTITLIVVPNPTVLPVSNPVAICTGFSSTLSATGASNYTWTPGALTGSSAVVSPTLTTTYTVVGNTAGCTGSSTVLLTVNYGPTLTAVASPTAICPGFTSTLSSTGAVSYTWNPGVLTGSAIVVSPPAGTSVYSVTGATAFGCLTTNTLSLLVNPTPTITPSLSSPSICVGSSATLSAIGAASYTWNPGALSGSAVAVSPTTTTTYTVDAASAVGCAGQNTITLIVVPNPTVSPVSNPVAICTGFSSTLSAIGASNYTWTPGAMTGSSAVVSPTLTTTYTVVGNTAGCTGSSTVLLTVNYGPTLTAVASPTAICPGFTSTLSSTGAVSYTWNPGVLTGSAIVVSPPAGTSVYSVTGATAFGCLTTNTLSLLVNPTPTITPSLSSPSICVGSSATLSAIGAASYTWNPGALSGSAIAVSPITTTNYTVAATSSAGCAGQNTITLIVVPNPTVLPVSNPVAICTGFSSTLSATGASNYTWTPGAMTGSSAVVSPTLSTTYTVVGNTAGCTGSSTVLLTVNYGPTLTAVASPTAICPGFTSTLSSTGAVSYTWNPGVLTGSAITVSPPAGTSVYSVTGATAFGCLTTNTLSLLVNPTPTITPSLSSPSICVGSSATLSAIGAASYTWNPGALSGSAVAVSPITTTNYTVAATSSAGCAGQNTITLIVVPNPTVLPVSNPVAICTGFSSTLSATGASNYTWTPGALTGSSAVVSPTLTTTYTVVGNTAGCTGSSTVLLTVNYGPTLTAVASPTAICPGFTSTLSSTGAVSYTWNPAALTGSAITVSPPAGTSVYSVTGATAFGCLTTNTLSLLVNPTPTITPSLSSPSICVGSSATLSAIGAASYTWNPGALSGSAVAVSPITTINYTVAATSSAGCAGQNTITLIVVPNPTVTASSNPTAVCLGASSTLSATGANSYTWIPGVITGSSTIVSPLVSTIYTVTGVTLACSNTKTVSLTINPLPSLTISSTSNPICSTNSATLSGTGAVTYTWLPGPITASAITVTPPVSTVYTLSGTGPLGCQNALIYTLTVNPTPTLLPLASSPTICAGFTSSLSVTGAVNYTFNPGGLTGSMVTVSPTVSTTYTVLGTTAFCASSQTVQVTVNPLPVIVSGSTPTNLCTGSTASLSASGAATYTWLPGNVSGSLITVNPMTTTIYTITATSSLGCVNSSTLSQLVSVSPTVTASSSSTVVCAGIPATLTAMGANTYTWMPGALTGSSIVVSPTVNTTYSVTGGNGTICNHSITITLSVNPLPPVLAATSNTSLCIGNSVTLTASGAVNYTWNPGGALTPSIVLSPTITGTYTLTGIDANGCSQQSVISVTVFNNPTITAVASPSTICDGNTTTLTSTGANTYTWIPGALLGSSVTATPSLSTTYTVNGKDLNGCADTETTLVNVLPNPVFSITAASPSICIGGSNILTATGALNYTWMPGAITNSVAVVNPTVTTTYTAVATNTTVCFTALTTTVFVNPLPANVTATTQGMITCASQTANLLATSSSSNLTYYWNGPLSFSSAVQNPTAVTVWGGFTVTITNTITGCIAAATTTILTDYSIPLVTQSPSLMLTCAVPVGTLLTVHTTTNPGYSWTGPSGYTSTAVTSTVTAPGNYSLIITDLSSGCTGTAMVSVGIHTAVVATASIAPATCSAGLSLNNGTIKVFNFIGTHKYALVAGSSFTGNVTYTTATGIPTTGIISNTLVNPTNTVVYTLRLFDVEGCIKDTALILQPVNCVISTLGLAKAVSLPTTNIDGTYNVTYTITAKSYDTTSFNNVSLTDKLNLAFPAPLTFTVVNPPSSISGTGLNLNAAFDGITNFSLTTASSSTMAAGASASFSFTVKIKTTSFYKPYYNSVVGVVKNGIGATVRDTSNVGFDTSPQKNVPTSVTFTPYVSFGLTKEGGVAIQNNNSLDISYTISVHNLGNDTLKHIVVKDSLLATVQQPANFSLKSGPVTGGGLTANSTFDGIYDLNLLSSENILPPGAVGKVSFVINVFPDTVTRLINSAYGTARYRPYATSLGFLTVSDLSNAGTKPDANNNGNCNEPSDNEPTVLMLPPTYTLFIPEGFSPDGDNINDLFVIKGLPRGSNSSLTIFNRWGNRVFYAENYSETTPWDGTPNIAGTFGKEKLPQGTYYYVLEMKGSENRSVTGFIVLQY